MVLLFVLLFIGIFSIFTIFYVIHKRLLPNYEIASIFLLISGAIWSFAYVAELLSSEFTTRLLFNKIESIGIITIPIAFLVFVLQFTGNEKYINFKNIGSLTVLSIAFVIMVFKNESLGHVWNNCTLVEYENISALKIEY